MGALESGGPVSDLFDRVISDVERAVEEKRRAKLLSPEEGLRLKRVVDTLSAYRQQVRSAHAEGSAAAELVRRSFRQAVEQRKQRIQLASLRLDRGFGLMETAFGEEQELVIFLTELAMNPYSMKFISDNGNEKFSSYNQALLLGGRRKSILDELN
jgi:hypothetical protein